MGDINNRSKKAVMVEVCKMDHRQEPPDGCEFCSLIRNRNRGEVTGSSELREGIVGDYEAHWNGEPTTQKLSDGLKADGAAIPESQATPIPREVLEEWSQTQELKVTTAAMIAWKTMSRWGEVAALSSANFIQSDPLTVIIDWNQIPKGKRENPFTASRFAVITGRWTEEINLAIRRLGFFDRLTKVDTPETTLRYAGSTRGLALSLRTARVTQHL